MLNKTKAIIKKVFFDKPKNTKPVQGTSSRTDFSEFEKSVIHKTAPYTMTSPERIVALIRASEHILKHRIEGDIVECGVWKGGSIMAVLHTLFQNKETRDIYLYDTFEGMTEPGEVDMSFNGVPAKRDYHESNGKWCYSSLEEVQSNFNTLPYPTNQLHFIQGKVENTIPHESMPNKIALLRLDTDWYESTKHEMVHLFPRLVKGGILIIDDYGHWSGCKKAIDEYFEENGIQLFLSRVDYTCRIGVKS